MDVFEATRLEALSYQFNETWGWTDTTDLKYIARDSSAAAFEPEAIQNAV